MACIGALEQPIVARKHTSELTREFRACRSLDLVLADVDEPAVWQEVEAVGGGLDVLEVPATLLAELGRVPKQGVSSLPTRQATPPTRRTGGPALWHRGGGMLLMGGWNVCMSGRDRGRPPSMLLPWKLGARLSAYTCRAS